MKFIVNNDTGFVSDDSVLVRISNLTLGIDHTFNASGEGNDFIKINETIGEYHVNIHTNDLGMPLGGYDIEVTFDSSQKETIGFELIQNGKGKGRQN